uniref:hypothetical protein n=1 Tax=uncultured Corynebacterium sp. TaxID=159447 RepID=UPI00263443C8
RQMCIRDSPEPGSNSPQKISKRYLSREKLKTQPKQTKPTPQKAALDWHIQKLLNSHPPTLTGQKGRATKNIQSVMQPTRTTLSHQWFRQYRPAHTKRHETVTQTNQTIKSLAHYRVLTQHTHTWFWIFHSATEEAWLTLLWSGTLCQLARNIYLFSSLRDVHHLVTASRTEQNISPNDL